MNGNKDPFCDVQCRPELPLDNPFSAGAIAAQDVLEWMHDMHRVLEQQAAPTPGKNEPFAIIPAAVMPP